MGKVIVITGAGGALCGTMAKALAKIDAKVAVPHLSEAIARTVVEEIKLNG